MGLLDFFVEEMFWVDRLWIEGSGIEECFFVIVKIEWNRMKLVDIMGFCYFDIEGSNVMVLGF